MGRGNPAKSILLALVFLALGVAIGWWAHVPTVRTVVISAPPASKTPSQAKTAAQPQRVDFQVTDKVRSAYGFLPAGLTAFLAIKQSSIPDLNISFFQNTHVGWGYHLSDQFIKLFGLTPDEVNRINASLDNASQQFLADSAKAATSRTDSAANKLYVDVGPFPEEGGAVRDELNQSIANVLGPDRFKVFQALSADQFEDMYNQFGLANTEYEVDMTPAAGGMGGQSLYHYTTSNGISGGMTNMVSNGSSGTMTAASLRKENPVLAPYMPAGLK